MKKSIKHNKSFVNHLKKGNKKYFSMLVELYNHKLCVYANSLVNDYSLAEDIVQNVFIRVWERRKSLNENYSLNSFLYKLVYNEFIDQYRKQQSIMLLEKKYIQTLNKITNDKDEDATQKMIGLIMQAIDNLPTKCKQIFLLSKKEGLTNIEISEYLNTSVKSVEGHITRAYSSIRKSVDGRLNKILFLIFNH